MCESVEDSDVPRRQTLLQGNPFLVGTLCPVRSSTVLPVENPSEWACDRSARTPTLGHHLKTPRGTTKKSGGTTDPRVLVGQLGDLFCLVSGSGYLTVSPEDEATTSFSPTCPVFRAGSVGQELGVK